MDLVATTIGSPLGPLTAMATDRGVCLLEFGNPERTGREVAELRAAYGVEPREGDHPHLAALAGELERYFAGDAGGFGVPLDTPGTPWQREVWERLVAIPLGETLSYGQMARDLGRPGGARAVGWANGSNRVAIVVPCHRVVETGGGLGGYGGGLERKRWLLEHEAAMVGRGVLFAGATAHG